MSAKYIHFSEDQKEQANSVDLECFLQSKGEQLIRSGKDKRLASDKSITIRGNSWYDHSNEQGGYSIDFVKMYYGLDFPSAMVELIGEPGNTLHPKTYTKTAETAKPFALPLKNSNMRRLFAYLTKHRGINPSVLSFFAHQKLVYESKEMSVAANKEYNNAVFVGMDKDGIPAHAHKRSLYSSGKKFMQNIESSNPAHSFHYLGGNDKIYVFEAPIDLLSFITIHQDSDWQSQNYVALCGTSSQPLVEQLNNNAQLNQVILCLDNDKAGHETSERFIKLLADRDIAISRIIPQGKDFNEQLINFSLENKYVIEPEMKFG